MDIVQSFLFSIGRCNLTVYEQRILCMIVKSARDRTARKLMKNEMYAWNIDEDNLAISVAMRDILSEGDQHYERVMDAFQRLMTRRFSVIDSSNGSWFSTPIVYNVTHDARSGVVHFYVAAKLMGAILDFSKGYRQYSIDTALALPSPVAVRLYILMCGCSSPLTFSVDDLKSMFGVDDKYKQTADFIKKVIEPARRILDDEGVTSFHFERMKAGRKVTAIKFYPIRRDELSDEQRAAKISTSIYLNKDIQIFMMRVAGFSLRELSAHKVLLDGISMIPSCMSIIADICSRAAKRGKSKGYIISALRSELESWKRCSDL